MRGFEALLALLLASAILAALARRVRLPAPIVMVFGGVAAAFLPIVQDVQLDPDVAFAIFVPPLLFRAAVTMSVHRSIDAELRLARREMAVAGDAWLERAGAERLAPEGVLERVRRHYARKSQRELDLEELRIIPDGEG